MYELDFNIEDDLVVVILKKYFKQVNIDICIRELSFYDALSVTMLVSECYEFVINRNIADELIHYNMKIIKKYLENKFSLENLSLFGGLTEVALVIYNINQKTGRYSRFLNSLNTILIEELQKQIDELSNNVESVDEERYDVMSGILGVASYILLFDEYNYVLKKLLKLIIKIYLSKYNRYKSLKSSFKATNKDNYIKLGLAHGLSGALVILSKAYAKGVIVEGQEEIINNIIKFYQENICQYEEEIYWDSIYYLDGDNNMKSDYKNLRDGWCSGSISIARSLLIAGEALKSNELKKFSLDILIKKSQQNLENLNLISPTLCHGYAGVLGIMKLTIDNHYSDSIECFVYKIKSEILNMFDKNSKYGFKDIEVRYHSGKHTISVSDNLIFLKGATGVLIALISLVSKKTILENHLLI